MQVNDFTFKKFDQFDLVKFTGNIVIICEKSGKLPFKNKKDMGTIFSMWTQPRVRDSIKSFKANDYVSFSLPVNMLAKKIIFFIIDGKMAAKEHLSLGSKVSKLIEKEDSVLLSDPKTLSLDFITGLILPSYRFTKYKFEKTKNNLKCSILVSNISDFSKLESVAKAICEGVFFSRDVTNEPSNYLNTETFSKKLLEFNSLGIKVSVISINELRQIGMNALIEVGKASAYPSKVVILEWNGRPASKKILGLVGKGVMFDSGGISLKGAGGMQEMTADMGGAGVIAGLFKTLALRKSKANVVGLLGLVENMPGGNAMKPGDIIRSLKGDTIEVVNTDAEGRLVLADLLWYCQTKYKPSEILDLATLTGAVEVALGQEYAGLFSNSKNLSARFLKACTKAQEKAWELPLDNAFDNLLSSRIADMKNSGGRFAGASTAAMFLKRFIKKSTPWAHLDIAGVSYRNNTTSISPSGSTGWGVRSINKFVEMFFEK